MSNTVNNSLFQLIKGLSSSEKRYFRLFVTKDGAQTEHKFLRLFDLVALQEEYSEVDILAQEPGFLPAQMSNLKAHLYQKILQSLRAYERSNIRDIQTRELIDHAQILYKRSLYGQCVKVLQKAKKLAQKHHNLELLLEVFKWEKLVLSQTVGKGNTKRVDAIVEQVRDVNNRINNINSFSNIAMKLNAWYLQKGFVRNQQDYNKVNSILNEGLPDYQESALSFYEKLHLYNLYVDYYFFIQDFEQGREFAQKWVNLIEQRKDLAHYLDHYLKGLNQLMIAEYKLMRYEDFVANHKRMKSIPLQPGVDLDANSALKLQKYTYSHLFNKFFMVGDFGMGAALFTRIKPALEEFIPQLDKHSRLVMYYKIACLYFGNNDFSESIKWLNRIINTESQDLREDVHGFARIINLICHFELGHTEVIPYYLRSTYRYLAKSDHLQKFQKHILAFIKRLEGSMSSKDLIEEFKTLRLQLLKLVDSPFEKRAFIYFDIISWLESKIEGQPVASIIKGKAQQLLSDSQVYDAA